MNETPSVNAKVQPPDQPPNEKVATIVGIGASAGGLPALQRFFAAMPPDSGMAFVVIMHLAPERESNLAALLQRHTAMTVIQVHETTAIDVIGLVRPELQAELRSALHQAFEHGKATLTSP